MADSWVTSDPLKGTWAGACANCGHPILDHCKVHLIPCCPGKCPLGNDGDRSPLENDGDRP